MTAVRERPAARAILDAETVTAWDEYLDSTRGQYSEARYEQVEPSAWCRLERRLAAIRARRKALRHVLDDGIAPADIRAAEAVGADWCCWSRGALAGCRIETTVAVALGVCTAVGDTTISGLDW